VQRRHLVPIRQGCRPPDTLPLGKCGGILPPDSRRRDLLDQQQEHGLGRRSAAYDMDYMLPDHQQPSMLRTAWRDPVAPPHGEDDQHRPMRLPHHLNRHLDVQSVHAEPASLELEGKGRLLRKPSPLSSRKESVC
jgi:hypothetical protein